MRRIYSQDLPYLLGLSLAALITTIFLSYVRYDKTIGSLQLVTHTGEVLKDVYQLESSLKSCDAIVAKQLIKPDTGAIRKVVASRMLSLHLVNSLGVLTLDNKKQQENINSLKPLIRQRYETWLLLVKQAPVLSDFEKDSILAAGQPADEQIDLLLRKMGAVEKNLLTLREKAGIETARTSPLYLLMTALITLSFVAFFIYMLYRALKVTKTLNDEIELKNTVLQRSNRDLEQFAYVASHDLQEPLHKIKAFGDRLRAKEQANLSEDGVRMLEKINGFAQRMQRLIDDLLEYSRVTSHKLELTQVSLSAALQEAISSLSEQIENSSATISYKDLPTITGYPTQLARMFQNLISNSIKYARSGVPPVIQVSYTIEKGKTIQNVRPGDEEKDFLHLTISDNGIGFDQQYADKIFVIFQRLHGKSEYEGTGIGLSVVKAVVSNHQGYIQASGKENEGAEFKLFFPLS